MDSVPATRWRAMKQAIYPGTFDPITFGHLDVAQRAAGIFDRLVVAVTANTRKNTLFDCEERVQLVRESLRHLPNVEVEPFEGLLVDYARRKRIHVLVRGIRAFSDFEYEFQMALTNRNLAPEVETVFLMPKEEHSYISSSMVKEIALLKGSVEDFVTEKVAQALAAKV